MDGVVCQSCGEKSVVLDPICGLMACEACGRVHDDGPVLVDGYAASYGGSFGGYGSMSYHRTSHPYTAAEWTEKKKRIVMQKLGHMTAVLRISADKVDEVRHFIDLFSEGRWGIGRWVDILIAACVYIVARQSNLPITLVEVAAAVSCDVAEVGRMFNRVLDTLQIKLPDANPSIFLERAIMSLPAFTTMSKSSKRSVVQHGLMLLDYCAHCSLTTGRHILPVVAAVILLVGEANQVNVGVAEVSQELHVSESRTTMRNKELKEALLGLAQKLPWGNDISSKTLHRHLPFLLQYLELDRKLTAHAKSGAPPVPDPKATHGPCVEAGVQDFEIPSSPLDAGTNRKRKVASEEEKGKHKLPRTQTSDLCKKVLAWAELPPAFRASQEAQERRRARIVAAKARIQGVMQDLVSQRVVKPQEITQAVAGRPWEVAPEVAPCGTEQESGLDDEDLLIEYLILRGANVVEIENGYYRALLGAPREESRESFSDQELAQYFRSKDEVSFLKSLEEVRSLL